MYENESLDEIDIFFIDKSPIIEMCFCHLIFDLKYVDTHMKWF